MGVLRPPEVHVDEVEPGDAKRHRVRAPVPRGGGASIPRARRCRTSPGTAARAVRRACARARRGRRASGCRSGARRPGGRPAGARSPRTPRSLRPGRAQSASLSRCSSSGVQPSTWASWNTRKARCSTLGGRGADAPAKLVPQPRAAGEPQCLPGRVGQGQPVQEQADRQELDQAACRDRVDGPVRRVFEEPHACRPAAQGEQRAGQEVVPFLLGRRRGSSSDSRIDSAGSSVASSRRPSSWPARAASDPAARPAGGTGRRRRDRTPRRGGAAASGQGPGPETPRRSGSAGRGPAGRCRPPWPAAAGRGAAPAASGGSASSGTAATPSRQNRHSACRAKASQCSSLHSSIRDCAEACSRTGRPGRRPGLSRPWPAEVAHGPAARLGDQSPRGRPRRRRRGSAAARRSRPRTTAAPRSDPSRSGYWSIASRSSSRVQAAAGSLSSARPPGPRAARPPGRQAGCVRGSSSWR